MSNRKKLLNSLFILLFLFIYQTSTLHSKKHFIDELSECHICQTSNDLSSAQHERTSLPVQETIAVEVNEVKEKKITKSSYDLRQTIQRQAVDYDGRLLFTVRALPPGYYATAPPYIFS